MPNSADQQYLDLLRDIFTNGTDKQDRTGTGTRSVFGRQMRFDLTDQKIPLLTSKKVFHKGIIHELLWMLSGDTNIRYLKENGVSIWDSWIKPETAEYEDESWDGIVSQAKQKGLLDSFNAVLSDYLDKAQIEALLNRVQFYHPNIQAIPHAILEWAEKHEIPTKRLVAGELPKIYQHQWRGWADTRIVPVSEWSSNSCQWEAQGFTYVDEFFDEEAGGTRIIIRRKIDQIQNVVDQLKENPDSRRIIVSAWNVAEIEEMALPPCHTLFQFWTRELTLDERKEMALKHGFAVANHPDGKEDGASHALDIIGIPTRALSCHLYQR